MKKYQVPDKPLMNNNHNLSFSEITKLYTKMIMIRYAEERIAQRVTEKKITTPCHLYIGQEAVAVGVCSVLRDSDFVFSTHRSHGHYLAKSDDIRGLFGEVYCRESGCSGGRGGSMHLCNPEKGLLGSSSIVAGCLGIGIGPALKSKILGLDTVSVIFHGDCVPEEGIWHESLNFAAIKKLPVIYVCENNLYAASAPLEERRVYDNISVLAKDHGLQTAIVDGNDVFSVYDAAKQAIEDARLGGGPHFIECRTYRWLGHVGSRDDIDVGLRSREELNWWKARCPILSLEKFLIENFDCSNALINIRNEIRHEIDEAETAAILCPKPSPDTLLENVYKESAAI